MAIYHCGVSVISRSAGLSSCAAAAYRAGEKITDKLTGLTHDYTRKGGVMYSETLAPAGSPVWATNRAELWNHVEQREEKSTRRTAATTAREFRVALPHELNLDEQMAVTRAFGQYLVNNYGVAVDYSIHAPDREGDDRNFHAHVLITDRRITDAGFVGKVRELSPQNGGRVHILAIREKLAEIVNQHLEKAGSMERVDHRSYKSQCVEREPTKHLGAAANALERRGEKTGLGNFNRAVAEINAIRAEIKAHGDELQADELANIYAGKEAAEIEAIEEADAVTIIELITVTRSILAAQDVDTTKDKASNSSGFDPASTAGPTSDLSYEAAALLMQHRLDQQKTVETHKQPATKRTFEERIKDAEAKAKADKGLRCLLALDHPSRDRGR
ncbi:MAG: MobQ family relaxase [Burkholderiales bacterium]